MNGPELVEPVFHFLDNAIREYGDYLYMGLVYVSIPLIGWILSGGLRRKQSAQEHTSIIVIHTPMRPPPVPPPIIGRHSDSFSDDDGDSFAA
jgi:hypothetical protein